MATDIKALGDQIVGQLISRHWAIKSLVLPFSKPRLWLTTLKKPTASKLLPVAPS